MAMTTTTTTHTATTHVASKPRSQIVSPSHHNHHGRHHYGHQRKTSSSSTPETAAHSRTRVISHGTGEASATKNYILGDCLGRGAFGSVYRALNWSTGETVAVKRVQLRNIPKSELGEIMREIELLKNLKHPNIVKYKGYEKTREYLFIVLEYCENGSLQNICKRFGKFPEGLVSIYTNQVLEGLNYLHEQGVIHRDIKGANILTTKDGSVKLADFGVATRTGAMSDRAVVGSPYWMAPEVIDQSGATAASDIWSVGCVVIELLEGQPPYHFLDPMPALFRIVQDDCPPLPDGVSPMVVDFLLLCFQKDATLRVSARQLLAHPWMASARRQLKQMKSTGSIGRHQAHDRAVQSVQAWNEVRRDDGDADPDADAPTQDREKTKTPPSLRRVAGNIANLYGDRAHRAQQQQARPPLRSIATANTNGSANVNAGLGGLPSPDSPSSEWTEGLYFASGTARPQAPKRPPLPKHFTEHAAAEPRYAQSAFTPQPQPQPHPQRPPYPHPTQHHRWSASDASPRRRTESCIEAIGGGGQAGQGEGTFRPVRTVSPDVAVGMGRSRSQHQEQRRARAQPLAQADDDEDEEDEEEDEDEQWAAVQPDADPDPDPDPEEDEDMDLHNMETIRPSSSSQPASRAPTAPSTPKKRVVGLPRAATGTGDEDDEAEELFVDASDNTPKASKAGRSRVPQGPAPSLREGAGAQRQAGARQQQQQQRHPGTAPGPSLQLNIPAHAQPQAQAQRSVSAGSVAPSGSTSAAGGMTGGMTASSSQRSFSAGSPPATAGPAPASARASAASAPVSPIEDYSDLLSAEEEPNLLEKIRKLRRQQVQGGATLGRRIFLPADLKAFANHPSQGPAQAQTQERGQERGQQQQQRERRLSRTLRAALPASASANGYSNGSVAYGRDVHLDDRDRDHATAAAGDSGITVVAPYEPKDASTVKEKEKDRNTTSPRTSSVLASGWETFKASASAPRRSGSGSGSGSAGTTASGDAHGHGHGLAAKFARRSAFLPDSGSLSGSGSGVGNGGGTLTGAGTAKSTRARRPGHVRASSSVSVSISASSYRASSPDVDTDHDYEVDDGAGHRGESYFDALEGQPPVRAQQDKPAGEQRGGAPGKEALAKFLRGWDRRRF